MPASGDREEAADRVLAELTARQDAALVAMLPEGPDR
jgi:hypothetical protein